MLRALRGGLPGLLFLAFWLLLAFCVEGPHWSGGHLILAWLLFVVRAVRLLWRACHPHFPAPNSVLGLATAPRSRGSGCNSRVLNGRFPSRDLRERKSTLIAA